MKRFVCTAACCVFAFALGTPTHAAIIDGTDVVIGGESYGTFQADGRTWLDLDNFWGGAYSYNSIVALLAGSGYHLATFDDMQQLFAATTSSDYAGEAAIMGATTPFGAYRGIFEDGDLTPPSGSNSVSIAIRFPPPAPGPLWSINENGIPAGTNFADYPPPVLGPLGAWVVADDVAATPEPASLVLWGLGSLGLAVGGVYRKRRSRKTTFPA